MIWDTVPDDATAQNSESCGDQHIERQVDVIGVDCMTQSIPLDDVITRWLVPVNATAQKRLSCGDHVTDCHEFPFGAVWLTHVVPLSDVMICPVPTAQSRLSSPDHVTDCHAAATGAIWVDQFVPLDDVAICWFVSPVLATATKIDSWGDHVTLVHETSTGAVRVVHVMPSRDDWNCVPLATATKRPRLGDHATLVHAAVVEALRLVHVIGDTFSNARQAGVVAELLVATYDPVPATVVVDPVKAGTIDVAVGAFPKVAEGIGVCVDVTMPATPSSCVVDPSWAEARFVLMAIRVP
jgi:hypothetical protein